MKSCLFTHMARFAHGMQNVILHIYFRLVQSSGLDFCLRNGTPGGVETRWFHTETRRDLANWTRAIVEGTNSCVQKIQQVTYRKYHKAHNFDIKISWYTHFYKKHKHLRSKARFAGIYILHSQWGDFIGQGEVCKLSTFTKRGEIACYNKKLGKINIKNQKGYREDMRKIHVTWQFFRLAALRVILLEKKKTKNSFLGMV